MKCAIYCRISTAEQDIENQMQVLKDFADRRGFEIVKIYQEEESGWRAGHQKELARLTEDARAGKFKIILVWSLDRLSREGPLAIMTLVDRLSKYGVKVISYQESWTEAPDELYDILLAIAGWVARMESQRISERTKAGLERARKYGTKSGIGIGKRGKDKPSTHRKRSGYYKRWEGINKGSLVSPM